MPINESKPRQRFRNRVEDLERHLQLVDAALLSLRRAAPKSKAQSLATLAGYSKKKYPRLNEPLSEVARTFNYSRARNVEMALVNLHRYVSDYVAGILRLLFDHSPLLVVGKALGKPNLQFREIVALGGWDALVERMVADVFRSLENERSTSKLISKVLDKTGADIDEATTEAALAFLEMRHLFIHSRGVIDKKFEDRFADLLVGLTGLERARFEESSRLPTTANVAGAGVSACSKLVEEIDAALLHEGMITQR